MTDTASRWARGMSRAMICAGLTWTVGCSTSPTANLWGQPSTARGPAPSDAVRVVSWNVEGVGAPGTSEYEALRAMLIHMDADVVGLNEISGSDDVAHLEELALDLGYGVVFGADADAAFGHLRNAVMSRFSLVEATALGAPELSGDPEANDLTRPLIRADFETPQGMRFTTLVGHWKSGSGNDDEFRRSVASTRAAQALDAARSSRHPVIVMGDMNAELDESESPDHFYEAPDGLPASFTLGEDLEGWLEAGLANDPFAPLLALDLEALDLTQPDGTDGTRPESGRRLDYLWVSEDVAARPIEGEVYTCGEVDPSEPRGMFYVRLDPSVCELASDHLPVIADVEVSGVTLPDRVVAPPITSSLRLEVPVAPAPVSTDWVVTEILPDPDACSDTYGEWVEIYNASDRTLPLAGLTLTDAYGHEAEVDGGEVAPGEYAVLGRSDAERFCGDVEPDGYYATAVSLNNTGDAITVGWEGEVVHEPAPYDGDLVEPGSSLVFDTASGAWCAAAPSPGEANLACD